MVRLFKSLLAAAAVASVEASDQDIILAPSQSDESLPERMLVFIPGAGVPTENYRATAEAIQQATMGLRLHVVIPAIALRKCIIQCSTSSTCFPLKNTVDAALAKSSFKGTNAKEDTFIAGHSMGSICANNFVTGYSYEFAGLLEFGGYVDKEGNSSVSQYPIPVLHLSGELDGGAARPGKLSLFYKQFKEYATEHGEDEALTLKPLHVLPGIDHSDFCPGFFVTAIKDLKSEVSQEEALQSISTGAAAFLHLNSPTSGTTKTAAMQTMKGMLSFTQEMCEPYLQAFEIESSGSLCESAQLIVSGLSPEDSGRLKVVNQNVSYDNFEHSRTAYEVDADNVLVAQISSSFEAPGGFGPADVHGAAKSIACKMLDSTRIGEQLQVDTTQGVQCGELTQQAVAIAERLLPQRSLDRYRAKGRMVCTADDQQTFGDIGPLFVNGAIKTQETEDCLEVSALSLENNIHSLIFPGVHYCKLLSPALAMEWMMTEGVKPFPYNLTDTADDVSYSVVV